MAASSTVGFLLVAGAALIGIEALRGFSNVAGASGNTTGQPLTGTRAPFGAGTESGKLVGQALQIAGAPASWLDGMMQLLSQEDASGDPHARNPIAVNGEHATGLFQFLPSTFNNTRAQHHLGPGNILNPLDNAITAVYYIRDKYGSPAGIPNLYKPPCRPGQTAANGCYPGY